MVGRSVVAGEALLAVGAGVGQGDVGLGAALDPGDGPQALVEAGRAAVQGVVALVLGHLVAAAVEVEGPVGDSVGEAAHRRAEVGGMLQVGAGRVEAQHDVAAAAAAVGRLQRLQRGAQRDDARPDALAVGELDLLHHRPVGKLAEHASHSFGRMGAAGRGQGDGEQRMLGFAGHGVSLPGRRESTICQT
jgi:hypothetical protein